MAKETNKQKVCLKKNQNIFTKMKIFLAQNKKYF